MKLDWKSQRVWVIGASSGIGAAVATGLAARGAQVAISARNQSELEKVSAGRMLTLPLDVEDVSAVSAAADRVRAELGGIDIVVILAGYWLRMSATEFNLADFTKHINVNVIGMANCVAAVLPTMQADRAGMIVGVSSVAGYRGMPGAEGYGPSKAAQLNFLESLRCGLNGSGVWVQSVSPGFVKTPMTSTNTFPMPFLITAERAAEYMIKGIERRKAEVVFPPAMAVTMKLARFVPQAWWPRLFKAKS